MREELAEQLEMMADRRTKIPSMVLIYPLDQHQLRSGLVGQKWMLKLCCMFPGGEHTLDGGTDVKEGETNTELGWYRLEDLGEQSAAILKWAKSHEKILKIISPRLGAAFEWVHQGEVTKFLGEQAENISKISIPESQLPSGAGEHLPVSSGLITLAGLRESDYRMLEGQGLVFLENVFRQYGACGNLHLFINKEGRMLWLCGRHRDEMYASRIVANAARREELLNRYLQHVGSQISKVRILGDSELHDLTKVFVELTILRDRERPSSKAQAEYWEMMNAKLRKRRNPLASDWETEGESSVGSKRKAQPEELLKADIHAVISGAPGSGKSTLLKYLAQRKLREQAQLPLFLELKTISAAEFASVDGNLPELVFMKTLAETICETESDRAGMREEFYKKLKAGHISIFLDGLDEVSGESFFADLRGSVKTFLQRGEYRYNSLYVSTRPYALLDHFSNEETLELEIAPFNQKQIGQFVAHYYLDDVRANEFLEKLRQRQDLRELASVPALLGFLILLYRNQDAPPQDRLELYGEIVLQLASEWDREKGAKRDFRTTATRRINFLSHLAFARLFNESEPLSRRFIFTGQEILREAERYCLSKGNPAQADLLGEEVKATALLRQVGTDAYAFAHLTLQEYMAATALSTHEERVRIFCSAYFDLTLSEMEVLPMTLGLAGHSLELHDALKAMPESLDHKKLRIRARSLGYGLAPDSSLKELSNELDQIVVYKSEIEYGYFNAVVRAYSTASGSAGEMIARNVAVRLGKNEAEYVKSRAVQALGIIGNETAIGLLRLALEDVEASVRIEAAALLALKDEKAMLEFLMLELRAEDNDIKEEVVNALWSIGSESAADYLEKALENPPFVRQRALEAIASIRGEAAVPILSSYLDDDEEWVRSTVVKSLGEIGGEKVIAPLILAVNDNQMRVAEEAVEFLGRIGGDEVIRFLTDCLEVRSGRLIGAVAEALGQAEATAAIPRLAQLLDEYKDDEPTDDFPSVILGGWINGYVRVRIAGALCQLGDERGHSILVEILTDVHSENKKYAAKALSRCHPDEAKVLLPDVISKIQDKYELVALAEVLCDLESCDDPRMVKAMLNVLNKSHGYSHNDIASGAINVLGDIGGQLAVEGLTKASEDHDPMKQLSAVVALGNIADETTVTGLLKGLTVGVNVVSEYAARGFARLDGAALYEGLKLNFKSRYPKVRRKVARCIFYYSQDEQAIELMSDLAVNDKHEQIKEAAQLALNQLEHKREWQRH